MPPAQRLVRRRPLRERIAAMLNPMDFLLWISEELETREWDSKAVGTQLGLVLSFMFLLARANAAPSEDVDDVFGEVDKITWRAFIVGPLSKRGGQIAALTDLRPGTPNNMGSRRVLYRQRELYHHESPEISVVRGQYRAETRNSVRKEGEGQVVASVVVAPEIHNGHVVFRDARIPSTPR